VSQNAFGKHFVTPFVFVLYKVKKVEKRIFSAQIPHDKKFITGYFY